MGFPKGKASSIETEFSLLRTIKSGSFIAVSTGTKNLKQYNKRNAPNSEPFLFRGASSRLDIYFPQAQTKSLIASS